MIGWSAVVFGINSTRNAGRKANSTRLRLALFYSFLPALLALLIPNTTADHPITYTNCTLALIVIALLLNEARALPIRFGEQTRYVLRAPPMRSNKSVGWYSRKFREIDYRSLVAFLSEVILDAVFSDEWGEGVADLHPLQCKRFS